MTAREHGWERVVAMGDVSIQRSQWLDAQCLELQLLVSGPHGKPSSFFAVCTQRILASAVHPRVTEFFAMSSHHSALLERLPAAHARCAAHLRARRQRDPGAKCPRPIANSMRRRLLRPWSHLLDLIAGVPICALACVVRPNLMLEPSSLAGQCIIDPHAWPNAQKKQQENSWSIDFSTRTSGAPAGVVRCVCTCLSVNVGAQ